METRQEKPETLQAAANRPPEAHQTSEGSSSRRPEPSPPPHEPVLRYGKDDNDIVTTSTTMDDRRATFTREVWTLFISSLQAVPATVTYAETEHVMKALLLRDDFAEILENCKIPFDVIAQQTESFIARNQRPSESVQKLTKKASKKVMSVEDIILGIEEDSRFGNAMFSMLGVSRQTLKTAIKDLQADSGPYNTNIPTIKKYGLCLTNQAREGRLAPVLGREKEINDCLRTLLNRNKCTPLLIGEAGVGKTAIVEGVALRIAGSDVPPEFQHCDIYVIPVGSLIAGSTLRGMYEQRLTDLLAEAAASKGKIILFLDEIHMLSDSSRGEGANIVKPMIARGEIRFIGATTLDEYRMHIEIDPAFARRFEKIYVQEASAETALSILKGLRATYERHHSVKISDSAISAAVNLSSRYINGPGKYQPDKAIQVMDLAASNVHSLMYEPLSLKEKREEILTLEGEIRSVEKEEELSRLRDEEKLLKKQHEVAKYRCLRSLNDQLISGHGNKSTLIDKIRTQEDILDQSSIRFRIDEDDVREVIYALTGIPIAKQTESEATKFLNLEATLQESIYGQARAIRAVSNALQRYVAGMIDPRLPIGAIMFMGPTGVGKTELSRSLAAYLFGSDDAFVFIDMTEFSQADSIPRLLGRQYGGGKEDRGTLEAVRTRPHSVVLFDEIEKAHITVLNLFLQILGHGKVLDSRNRKIDFTNALIIMTSNIGAEEIMKAPGDSYQELKKIAMRAIEAHFSPEFIGRVNNFILFAPLNDDSISRILAKQLHLLNEKLLPKGITLSVPDEVKDFLVSLSKNTPRGGREVGNVVIKYLENKVAKLILMGECKRGSSIVASMKEPQVEEADEYDEDYEVNEKGRTVVLTVERA